MLLGQRLQKAGLNFISAKGIHKDGGLRIQEIVCATSEDADRVLAWAESEGFPAEVRVATEDELERHKQFEDML